MPCYPSDQQPWPVRKCDERGWGGGLCVLEYCAWLFPESAFPVMVTVSYTAGQKWIGNWEQVLCSGYLQISQTHHLQAAVILKGNKNVSQSWVFLQSSAALSIALLKEYLEVLQTMEINLEKETSGAASLWRRGMREALSWAALGGTEQVSCGIRYGCWHCPGSPLSLCWIFPSPQWRALGCGCISCALGSLSGWWVLTGCVLLRSLVWGVLWSGLCCQE